MVGAPALGCVHNNGGLQAQPQPQQVVVHSAHREQGGDGGVARGDAAIGEHQDRFALAHGRFRCALQTITACCKPAGPSATATRVERVAAGKPWEVAAVSSASLRIGLGRCNIPAALASGFRDEPRRQMHLQAHHQFFPQRIDRRVGDLGQRLAK